MAVKFVFVRCKDHTLQIALGNLERRRGLLDALPDIMPNPRRFLLLGFAIRFLPLCTGKVCSNFNRIYH